MLVHIVFQEAIKSCEPRASAMLGELERLLSCYNSVWVKLGFYYYNY